MNKHLNNWLDEVEGKAPETTNDAINKERRRQNKPEFGKVYSLTGGIDQPSIANGNTWAESEVKEEKTYSEIVALRRLREIENKNGWLINGNFTAIANQNKIKVKRLRELWLKK